MELFVHVLTSCFTLDSATQEDEMGQLYLSNVDFLKNGVPASIIATMVRDQSSSLTALISTDELCRSCPPSDIYS